MAAAFVLALQGPAAKPHLQEVTFAIQGMT
ncbi:MAG: hypothetical protein QOJ65_1770 [Fimbriimonadaceae bacterium]|jgi:hypothetical protein|nr:hypothetical protein [Fimbriimonadaceae bacterium]